MPLNLPGLLVPLQLIWHPELLVPSLIVRDLRCLNFHALKKLGYRGAVFDKDNCLTLPHEDRLVPGLKDAWNECHSVFGSENVIIVSNSAGTRVDPSGIQAESVSHHLGVRVLRHQTQKPGYSCIQDIRRYFASLKKPIADKELVIIGDRVFTDIVLANRMRVVRDGTPHKAIDETVEIDVAKRDAPLAVLTDKVWKKESMFMRFLEKKMASFMTRWAKPGQVLTKEQEALITRQQK